MIGYLLSSQDVKDILLWAEVATIECVHSESQDKLLTQLIDLDEKNKDKIDIMGRCYNCLESVHLSTSVNCPFCYWAMCSQKCFDEHLKQTGSDGKLICGEE